MAQNRQNKDWKTVRGQRDLNEAGIRAYGRLMDAEIALNDLRIKRGFTQGELADVLEVSQPNVSRIEQEDDIYLSTLIRYVAALGGHVEIKAIFEEETVTVLNSAGDVTRSSVARPGRPAGPAAPESTPAAGGSRRR